MRRQGEKKIEESVKSSEDKKWFGQEIKERTSLERWGREIGYRRDILRKQMEVELLRQRALDEEKKNQVRETLKEQENVHF